MEATLTILFTDAVASTAALARLGDEPFREVQDAHLGLLRRAADAHGGREVKSLGDGLMVAFTGAADAIACAVEMQQAVDVAERRGEPGLPLRVGIASGDVSVDGDGDCHGTAVVEAARLCAAAARGQVLATEVARALAGSRGGHAFTSLGALELKGLAAPVGVIEVGWAPLAEGDALAPVPLSPRLATVSSWKFVGRVSELRRLEALLAEVADGATRVALLGGEPGTGKSRMAQEVARRAHADGALVLFGRVDEDLAVAYQPFAEALRHYLGSVDDARREQVLDLRAGALGRLVPDVVDDASGEQVEAWAILEALVDWLADEAERRPVVLVLDDLHWAARPTLLALMHLARSERLGGVLILGTYRDTDLSRAHPLAAVLADLRREDGVERLNIPGLDADEVTAFVRAARGGTLDAGGLAFSAALSERTQGNPFFVGQVLRHLAESAPAGAAGGTWLDAADAELVVPEGVREVVGRRVARLNRVTGDLLTVAAVAGPDFDTAVVAEVAGRPITEALDAFDEAVAARLLVETSVPGRLAFAHTLVRQTLEQELSTLRRVHLHRDIGLAIERRAGGSPGAVAELAHHFGEAAVAGEGDRASDYTERAADQALARGAPEQAADLVDRALELLPPEIDPDGLRRDRLFHLLARCCARLFDLPRMERVSRRWTALGDSLGDDIIRAYVSVWLAFSTLGRAPEPDDLARVADALRLDPSTLDFTGRTRRSVRDNVLPLDAPALRAWVLMNAASSWALGFPLAELGEALVGPHPLVLADAACRAAAESADPEIADEGTLLRGFTLLAHPDAEEQLTVGNAVVAAGYTGGGGSILRGLALARLGRLDELRAHTDEMIATGDRRGDRGMLANGWTERALEALVRGRRDEARVATERGMAALPEDIATQLTCALLNVARLLTEGRAAEARSLAELLDSSPVYDVSHLVGVGAAAQEDLETPRAVLDAWRVAGRPLPVDLTRTGRLWGLARCAHAMGDRDAAAHLHPHLVPYDGQLLVYAVSFVPASAAFILGLIAETLGRRDEAIAHHTRALAFEERIGAQMLAAGTRDALARLRGD